MSQYFRLILDLYILNDGRRMLQINWYQHVVHSFQWAFKEVRFFVYL